MQMSDYQREVLHFDGANPLNATMLQKYLFLLQLKIISIFGYENNTAKVNALDIRCSCSHRVGHNFVSINVNFMFLYTL